MASVHFLICISDRQWQIFRWQGNHCNACISFAYADREEVLNAWLKSEPHAVVTLLTDLTEEHYHIEVLPSVRGRARKQLLLRKLADWPPAAGCHAVVQLDSLQGLRREDRYLFTGVSMEIWQDSLQGLQHHSVAINGIYLQTSCLAAWVACLLPSASQVFCLHGSAQQCRLSYLHQGKLFFSRQLRLPVQMNADALVNEINQTRMYVQHQRWLGEGESLSLLLVTEDAVLEALMPTALLPSDIKQLRVTAAALFQQLRLPLPNVAISAMAWSAMHAVMRAAAPNHATPQLLTSVRLQSIKRHLYRATCVTAIIGTLGVLNMLQQQHQLQLLLIDQQQQLNRMLTDQSVVIHNEKDLPGMQALIEAAQTLIAAQRTPQHLMQVLQQASSNLHAWRLHKVHWQYGPQEKPQTVALSHWQEQAWLDFVKRDDLSAEDAQQEWERMLASLRQHPIFMQMTTAPVRPEIPVNSAEGDTRFPRQTLPVRRQLHVLIQSPATVGIDQARSP